VTVEGLRKHQAPFLHVPSEVLRNTTVSVRAKGLLCYLLDKPEGWVPRYRLIAKEFPEGQQAIQSSLRELRLSGYYLSVKQRRSDGRWVTLTEVSDTAKPEWIEQARHDFGL
jgi:hypothetical protein